MIEQTGKYYATIILVLTLCVTHCRPQQPDCAIDISESKEFSYFMNMGIYSSTQRIIEHLYVHDSLFLALCFTNHTFETNTTSIACNDASLKTPYLALIRLTKQRYSDGTIARWSQKPELLYETYYGVDSKLDISNVLPLRNGRVVLQFWYNWGSVGTYLCSFMHYRSEGKRKTITSFRKDAVFVPKRLEKIQADILLVIRSMRHRHWLGDLVVFTCDWEEDKKESPKEFSVQVLLGGRDKVRHVVTHFMNIPVLEKSIAMKQRPPIRRAVTTFIVHKPNEEELRLIREYQSIYVQCKRGDKYSDKQQILIGYPPRELKLTIFQRNVDDRLNQLTYIHAHVSKYAFLDTKDQERILQKHPLHVGNWITCKFDGIPIPTVEWEIPKEYKDYLKPHLLESRGSAQIEIVNYTQDNDLYVRVKCVANSEADQKKENVSSYVHFYIRSPLIESSLVTEYNIRAQVENFIMIFLLLGWFCIQRKLVRQRRANLQRIDTTLEMNRKREWLKKLERTRTTGDPDSEYFCDESDSSSENEDQPSESILGTSTNC